MNNFVIYILSDDKKGRYYVGQTKNLDDRLSRHISRREKYTRSGRWELVYQETYKSRPEALKREKEIKGWKSKIIIRRLVGTS